MAVAQIITGLANGIVQPIADIVGKRIEDKDLANQLTADLQRGLLGYLSQQLEAASRIIVAEAQGGSWLQRSWRPITMLVFVGLVVARWLGYVAPNVTPEVEGQLFEIIKLGLAGYVVGRSAEKVARVWKANGN